MNIIRVVAETFRRVRALSSVDQTGGGGWFSIIREAWAGAWQSNTAVDDQKNVLAFSAVYACVSIIAGDIAKLALRLLETGADGIDKPVVSGSPFLAVLAKPNPYQTRLQFIEQWITQKLINGAAFVLKSRDQRGVVREMYVLDSNRVRCMVADNGDVYYQLSRDDLSGVTETTLVPAYEIIHDRMICFFHPLVGVTPIFACGMSATMGNKIQINSARFFRNMSRPSGYLTAPGKIDDETAARMKKEFDENYGGENIGRIMVTGAGLEFKPAPAINAADAQLIEQLKWTVEDVARSFHMPLFKLGGAVPAGSTVEALDLIYYKDCLQTLIESLELCLDDGLSLPVNYHTECDLDGLLRMDALALIKAEAESVKGSIKTPNEARRKLNLGPVPGGDAVYMQQQNFSTEALAKRDAKADPFETTPKPAPAAPAGQQQDQPQPGMRAVLEEFGQVVVERLRALPPPAKQQDEDEEDDALELVRLVAEGLAPSLLLEDRSAPTSP